MKVITTSLQMSQRPAVAPRPVPDGLRIELAHGMTPEYGRFLYGLVGGNWNWTDRINWTREQWSEVLSVAGTEFWILYCEGVPLGYIELQPQATDDATQVEIRYFGLAEQAVGRGLGATLLEYGIARAWELPSRYGLPDAQRVWVHTCSLDGPAALPNYQARGFEIFAVDETDEDVADVPLGAWAFNGGPSGNSGETT